MCTDTCVQSATNVRVSKFVPYFRGCPQTTKYFNTKISQIGVLRYTSESKALRGEPEQVPVVVSVTCALNSKQNDKK